jgi:hypothetical protein
MRKWGDGGRSGSSVWIGVDLTATGSGSNRTKTLPTFSLDELSHRTRLSDIFAPFIHFITSSLISLLSIIRSVFPFFLTFFLSRFSSCLAKSHGQHLMWYECTGSMDEQCHLLCKAVSLLLVGNQLSVNTVAKLLAKIDGWWVGKVLLNSELSC